MPPVHLVDIRPVLHAGNQVPKGASALARLQAACSQSQLTLSLAVREHGGGTLDSPEDAGRSPGGVTFVKVALKDRQEFVRQTSYMRVFRHWDR